MVYLWWEWRKWKKYQPQILVIILMMILPVKYFDIFNIKRVSLSLHRLYDCSRYVDIELTRLGVINLFFVVQNDVDEL